MPFNLWGINPKTKKPEAYIGHIAHGARSEWEQKALSEGWTHLTWGSDKEIASSSTATTDSDPDGPQDPSPKTTKASGGSRSTRATRTRSTTTS
jgi:hypothetical protein